MRLIFWNYTTNWVIGASSILTSIAPHTAFTRSATWSWKNKLPYEDHDSSKDVLKKHTWAIQPPTHLSHTCCRHVSRHQGAFGSRLLSQDGCLLSAFFLFSMAFWVVSKVFEMIVISRKVFGCILCTIPVIRNGMYLCMSDSVQFVSTFRRCWGRLSWIKWRWF